MRDLFAVTTLASQEYRGRFVRELKGTKLLVKTMDPFEDDIELQICACQALFHLAATEELTKALKKGGAVSAAGKLVEKELDEEYAKIVQPLVSDLMVRLFGEY